MDLSGMDGWVGTAIAVVLGIAALGFARRYGTRRGRLVADWSVTPLLSSVALDVAITHQGDAVEDPHLVRVLLRNPGPIDIPSARFDDGGPLRLTFTTEDGAPVRIFGIFSPEELREVAHADPDSGSVLIPPQLIKAHTEHPIEFLTAGRPTEFRTSDLIDVDISHAGARAGWKISKRDTFALLSFWALLGLYLVMVYVPLPFDPDILLISVLLVVVIGATIAVVRRAYL